MTTGKIIILTAPSGAGKSTLIRKLIDHPSLNLGFSVSATSRAPRGTEQDGVEYYFLSPEEFKAKVDAGEFVEWAEVYSGTCYGTLESEVKRVTESGRNLIMDVDVEGALNIKKRYGKHALSVFILPPSLEILEQRLRGRCTDTEESIAKRLGKAKHEISFAPQFDCSIVNDDLDSASDELCNHIKDFIS